MTAEYQQQIAAAESSSAPDAAGSKITKRPDNRITGTKNEESILHALCRYGFLSTRQIQARVWPNATSLRQAERTMANLKKKKQVLLQYAPDGCRVYCLTTAGARRVSEVFKVDAKAGANNLKRCFHTVAHRMASNDLCIWWQTAGPADAGDVNTEYEIASKRAILNKKEASFGKTKGKIPDALLLKKPVKDPVKGVILPIGWGEVEMSDKNGAEYMHLVSELCQILGGYGKERYMLPGDTKEVQFAVVSCPKPSHETKLVKAVLTHLARYTYNEKYVREGIHIRAAGGALTTLENWYTARPEMHKWRVEMMVQLRYEREREADAKEKARRGR